MTSRPPLTLVPPPDTAPPGDTVTRLDMGVAERPARTRYVGPDVVRALALIGVVVMNYHGYLILLGGRNDHSTMWGRFFDPWTGPLSTRFAATFVLVAGVGVTLLTNGVRLAQPRDRAAVASKRWTLLRRGLALYAFGLMFNEIWDGTILPYYGAMFAVSAAIFTLATPWIATIGIAAALAGAGIEWWATERAFDGHRTSWLLSPPSGSPRGLAFNVFVNGTHPLLPWLAFLCAGIILGRSLRTTWWRPVALVLGVILFAFATLLSDSIRPRSALSNVLASNDPFDRGLLYTASALGTALVAFTVISTLAERWSHASVVQWFAHAGQMSLTLYVLHALVFNFVVRWHGWVRPTGLDTALTFAAIFWLFAIAAASWWHRRFGIGPVEWVYRKIGA